MKSKGYVIRIRKNYRGLDKPKVKRLHKFVDTNEKDYTTLDKALVYPSKREAETAIAEPWEEVVKLANALDD